MSKSFKTEDEEHPQSILDQSGSEILVFGCIRLWFLLNFPDALCHLIVHYYGVTFLWTIQEPNDIIREFKSKPFIINGITFQSYFSPNTSEYIADNSNEDKKVNIVQIGTKIISMSNTIRTCTAYYEYSIFNETFRSRHTYTLVASRAKFPKQYLKGIEKPIYPIQILICVEPIRIHHWSYDKVIDYQQDILMKEYVEYQWRFNLNKENRNNTSSYLQSETFGICWCLDLDLKKEGLYLKLLRLAPNITRITAECSVKSINWKRSLKYQGVLKFAFTNDAISQSLNDGKFDKNRKYLKIKDTIFDIEIRIIEVYAIDSNQADAFEFGNDKEIPINKWTQYGIV